MHNLILIFILVLAMTATANAQAPCTHIFIMEDSFNLTGTCVNETTVLLTVELVSGPLTNDIIDKVSVTERFYTALGVTATTQYLIPGSTSTAASTPSSTESSEGSGTDSPTTTTEANPCLFGFNSTSGHTCNPEFSSCIANSSLESRFVCECLVGFTDNDTANPGHSCNDIDECADATAACGAISSGCTNTPGSFSCICFSGFSGAPCEDIDECEQDSCVGSTCKNSAGSFQCECLDGYQRQNPTSCNDIDECAEDSHICGDFGHCNNTDGSFTCICNDGFYNNNVTCVDIDECDENPCNELANCNNTVGSFTCECFDGYAGTGLSGSESCHDQNECEGENGGHDCNNTFAECRNEDGGFSCQCKEGFTDEDGANTGRNCTESQTIPTSGPVAENDTMASSTVQSNTASTNLPPTEEATSSPAPTTNVPITGTTANTLGAPQTEPVFQTPTTAAVVPRSNGLSDGAVVGIVLGSLFGLLLIILGAVFLYRRLDSKKSSSYTMSEGGSENMYNMSAYRQNDEENEA